MCGICGCSSDKTMHANAHDHRHDHEHAHTTTVHLHAPVEKSMMQDTEQSMRIAVEQNLLAQNNQFAANNRDFFIAKGLVAMNLMSSPGSGKTTLLAKTVEALNAQFALAVVVGDQETDYDAQAIRAAGGEAVQVNTGRVCHLDAHAVGHALDALSLGERGIVFIENVGNLVCPALFDLGEHYRIVVLSVTEGENKPLKYPDMFHRADLVLMTKTDLLPYIDFNWNQCIEFIHKINPSAQVISVSAKTGEGMATWIDWLQRCVNEPRSF